MATITATTSTATDWPDRYLHIDKVLDQPGPSTDPSFSAGEPVYI